MGGVQLPVTAAGWLGVGGVVLLGTVMAIAFFLAGLERLGAVRASVYSTLEPVFTLALSAALLDEALTPLRLAGRGAHPGGGAAPGARRALARADGARRSGGVTAGAPGGRGRRRAGGPPRPSGAWRSAAC